MRNWKVTLLMFTMFALVAAGCGTPFHSDDARGGSGKSWEPLQFRQESQNSLPDEVKQRQVEVMQTAGDQFSHTEVNSGDRTYLILALGQRPTGGYSIRINEVVQKGNTIRIHAEEVPPAPDAFTTQAISSPRTVISLASPKGEVKFDYRIGRTKDSKEASPAKPASHAVSVDDPEPRKLDARPEPRLAALPDTVKQKVEELRSRLHGGEAVVHHGDQTYLIIALGQRRSGGYGVALESIQQKDRKIHVHARETAPAPGAFSLSALTNPVHVFSLARPDHPMEYAFHVQTKSSPPGGGEIRD